MPHYLSPKQGAAHDAGAERALVTAILHQAILDAQSSVEAIRTEAERFWNNEAAVATWADVLEVDTSTLQRAVQRRLRTSSADVLP
jgi:hypothetical protein